MTIVLSLSIITAFAAPMLNRADDVNVTGKWSLVADANGQSVNIGVELKQTGSTFTGTTASEIGNGTMDGGKVTGKTFTATLHADVQGQPMDFAMTGSVDGDKMTGSFTNAAFGTVPFTATKSK